MCGLICTFCIPIDVRDYGELGKFQTIHYRLFESCMGTSNIILPYRFQAINLCTLFRWLCKFIELESCRVMIQYSDFLLRYRLEF